MKALIHTFGVTLFTLIFGTFGTMAQALDCPALFTAAAQAAFENCSDLQRNQACVASGTVSMTDVNGESLSVSYGDRIDVSTIGSFQQTSEEGWGFTIMQLQLSQPAEVVEHNTVLMVLGDVAVTVDEPVDFLPQVDGMSEEVVEALAIEAEEDVSAPFTSFQFESLESSCSDELPNGILLQSPNLTPGDEGYLATNLTINNWTVSMGSTAYAETGDGTTLFSVLEHFGFFSSSEGDGAMVGAGQSAALPDIPRTVSNEDGSVVVTDGPLPEDTSISEYLGDLLNNLGNREPEAPAQNQLPQTSGTVAEGGEPDIRLFTDGFWYFDVGETDVFGGDMCRPFDVSPLDGLITLDDYINVDENGDLLGFIWPIMGVETTMPFEDYNLSNFYITSAKDVIGDTIISVSVVSPMMAEVRVSQFLNYISTTCVFRTSILMSSCMLDVYYGKTDGTGRCPREAHEGMGTR
jgi:hypothetical protein